MEELVDKGLVRSIGLSNFNSKQISKIHAAARIPISNLQVECHAYMPQVKLHQFCQQHGIVMTAYSVLGSAGLFATDVWVENEGQLPFEVGQLYGNIWECISSFINRGGTNKNWTALIYPPKVSVLFDGLKLFKLFNCYLSATPPPMDFSQTGLAEGYVWIF